MKVTVTDLDGNLIFSLDEEGYIEGDREYVRGLVASLKEGYNPVHVLYGLFSGLSNFTATIDEPVQLFNPYHDKFGRFTNKEGAVGDVFGSEIPFDLSSAASKYKQWMYDHKTEVAIGLGIAAAAGVTALVLSTGVVDPELVVEGVWSGTVQAVGDVDGTITNRISIAAASAANMQKKLGVNISADRIFIHANQDTYSAAMGGAKIMPTELAAYKDGAIHVTPTAVGVISDVGDNDQGLTFKILSHELYHGRANRGSLFDLKSRMGYSPAMGPSGLGDPSRVEEGLAVASQSMASLELRGMGGIGVKESDILSEAIGSRAYERYLSAIMSAARKVSSESGASFWEVLRGWVAGDPDKTIIRILEIHKDMGIKLEEAIELFNPYHDELGRFTTAAGSSSYSGYAGKGEINLTVEETRKLRGEIRKIESGIRKQASGSFRMEVVPTTSMDEFVELTGIKKRQARSIMGLAGSGGKLYINPNVVQSLAGRDNELKIMYGLFKLDSNDFRKFSKSVISHEILHSRKRKYPIPYKGGGNMVDSMDYCSFMEEGTNEALNLVYQVREQGWSDRDVKKLGTYSAYVASIAKEARARYPNSRTDALKWISKAHKTGFTHSGIKESFGDTFKSNGRPTDDDMTNAYQGLFLVGGTQSDINWLMGAASSDVKLEEEKEAQDIFLKLILGKIDEAIEIFKKNPTLDGYRILSEWGVKNRNDKVLDAISELSEGKAS